MRFLVACVLLGVALPLRAVSVIEQVAPLDPHPGDEILVSFTVLDASVGKFALPTVDGLQPTHDVSLMTTYGFNNGIFSSRVVETFHLVASRAGDYTIPAFDVPLAGGGTAPAAALTVHVSAGEATSPPAPAADPAPSPGPVVMPPAGNPAQQPGDANPDAQEPVIHAPIDPDGQPAKVFLLATAETTQAYVKQAIKLRIDFFIRVDAMAPQDSLPVVKGSDFLVTNVSERPRSGMVMVDDRQYQVDSWSTAVLPLKAGDLELTTERDTYWNKDASGGGGLDAAIGSFLGRHNDLGHQNIPSNSLTIHVSPLPEEGRPTPPSDAVGQYSVTADVQPTSIAVGEPVTLYFVVNGSGNFNYVRSPALASTSDWKVYPPQSRVTFRDEAHTEGYKSFEQSLIPLKPGTLHLPAATFSFFDPVTKQYSSPPIDLPVINVAPGQAPAPPPSEGPIAQESGVAAATSFRPNRIFAGAVRSDLAPAFRRPWFWGIQAGAVLLPALALLALAVQHRRRAASAVMATREQKQRALRHEQEAMGHAAQRGDALAFFVAARHSLQLQLSGRWDLPPETITLRTIEARDAALAETLAPFFAVADEVIYSGRATGPVDFAHWQALVLHPFAAQPA